MNSNHSGFSIALFEPRIPQNTGCIARTCAAFSVKLHLICPLGFSLEDKFMKRAGLDYWQYVDLIVHDNYTSFLKNIDQRSRIIGFSKSAKTELTSLSFKKNDILLFGREDTGLPPSLQDTLSEMSCISMPGGVQLNNGKGVRSLNLSVAVGIATYNAYTNFKIT